MHTNTRQGTRKTDPLNPSASNQVQEGKVPLHLSHASLFSQMCCELGTELTHLQDRKRKEGDGKGRRQIGLGVLGLLTAGC
jgi:hypothetical protein